jgi:hypothetical protein
MLSVNTVGIRTPAINGVTPNVRVVITITRAAPRAVAVFAVFMSGFLLVD